MESWEILSPEAALGISAGATIGDLQEALGTWQEYSARLKEQVRQLVARCEARTDERDAMNLTLKDLAVRAGVPAEEVIQIYKDHLEELRNK